MTTDEKLDAILKELEQIKILLNPYSYSYYYYIPEPEIQHYPEPITDIPSGWS